MVEIEKNLLEHHLPISAEQALRLYDSDFAMYLESKVRPNLTIQVFNKNTNEVRRCCFKNSYGSPVLYECGVEDNIEFVRVYCSSPKRWDGSRLVDITDLSHLSYYVNETYLRIYLDEQKKIVEILNNILKNP